MTATELNEKLIALETAIDEGFATVTTAVTTEATQVTDAINALKEQVANGDGVTPADLDALGAKVDTMLQNVASKANATKASIADIIPDAPEGTSETPATV